MRSPHCQPYRTPRSYGPPLTLTHGRVRTVAIRSLRAGAFSIAQAPSRAICRDHLGEPQSQAKHLPRPWGSPCRYFALPGRIDVPAHVGGVIAIAIAASLIPFATSRQGILVKLRPQTWPVGHSHCPVHNRHAPSLHDLVFGMLPRIVRVAVIGQSRRCGARCVIARSETPS